MQQKQDRQQMPRWSVTLKREVDHLPDGRACVYLTPPVGAQFGWSVTVRGTWIMSPASAPAGTVTSTSEPSGARTRNREPGS